MDALPSQTSQSGKFLTTDGSDASWGTVAGGLSYAQQWQLTADLSIDNTDNVLESFNDSRLIVLKVKISIKKGFLFFLNISALSG